MGQHRSRDASFVVPADDVSVAKGSSETGKYPGPKGGLDPGRLVGAFFEFHEHEHERPARVLESLALDAEQILEGFFVVGTLVSRERAGALVGY